MAKTNRLLDIEEKRDLVDLFNEEIGILDKERNKILNGMDCDDYRFVSEYAKDNDFERANWLAGRMDYLKVNGESFVRLNGLASEEDRLFYKKDKSEVWMQ